MVQIKVLDFSFYCLYSLRTDLVLGMEHTLAVWVLITVLSSIAKKNAVGLSAIDKTKWVIKVKLLCICDDNFLDFVVVLRWRFAA